MILTKLETEIVKASFEPAKTHVVTELKKQIGSHRAPWLLEQMQKAENFEQLLDWLIDAALYDGA